jgi:hypothetical protein
MTQNTIHATEILAVAIDKVPYYIPDDDAEMILQLVTAIGELNRDDYLALRSHWKQEYAGLSVRIRTRKPERKGNNFQAMYDCTRMKREAREMMIVRKALKQIARDHAQARKMQSAA